MPRAVQRATAADGPYSMSSGCATTQSTRWKDSSGRAGNVMPAILPGRPPPCRSSGVFAVVGGEAGFLLPVAARVHVAPLAGGGFFGVVGEKGAGEGVGWRER